MLNSRVVRDYGSSWGTPAGQDFTDEAIPDICTFCVLPSRKLRTHSHKPLVTFNSANFVNRISWSTRSNALVKSRKSAWTPFLPFRELSVALNQFCEIFASAETVERPVKACWFFLILILSLFSLSWIFTRTLAICGKTEIWRKSVSMSLGGLTLGTGVISACL